MTERVHGGPVQGMKRHTLVKLKLGGEGEELSYVTENGNNTNVEVMYVERYTGLRTFDVGDSLFEFANRLYPIVGTAFGANKKAKKLDRIFCVSVLHVSLGFCFTLLD